MGGITSGRLKATEKRDIKLLNFALDMYKMRMDVLNKYNYEEGKKWMTAELTNYLVTIISSISSEDKPNETIREIIEKYLILFEQNKKYVECFNNEKYEAFRSGDVMKLYSYCRYIHKHRAKKRFLKKFIHRFIQ